MPASIHPFDPENEFYTPERCFITELSNNENDPDVSIARARVEPGITTAWHKLQNTSERYVIVSGEGRVEIAGLESSMVAAGDVVCIPPNAPQRITNTGTEDLIFLAVCSPRFVPECYVSLE